MYNILKSYVSYGIYFCPAVTVWNGGMLEWWNSGIMESWNNASGGMRLNYNLDGTDKNLKSGPHPLFIPNIPPFQYSIIPFASEAY